MLPSDAQVRGALARVSASEHFRHSERLRTFLVYIVEETLGGRADRIKSYTIGATVFGKDNTSDDSGDGVVRTTAIRLRDALEKYYRSEGCQDEIIISLPKGRYIPEFRPNEARINVSQSVNINLIRPSPRWRLTLILAAAVVVLAIMGTALYGLSRWSPWTSPGKGVYLVVQQTSADGATPAARSLATGFSDLLVEQLVGIGTAHIIGPIPADAAELDRQLASMGAGDVLVLNGTLRAGDKELAASWRLFDGKSKVVLWAGQVHAPAGDHGLEELAGKLAFGVLGTEGAVSLIQGQVGELAAVSNSCISNAQRLAIVFDTVFQSEQIDCLERAVAEDPRQSEAWALLSLLYSFASENVGSLGEDHAPLVEKASASFDKAYALAPNAFLTQEAQLFLAHRLGQYERFERMSRQMLERYPGDPNLRVRIGVRFILSGQFEVGRRLVEDGITSKQSGNPWDYMSLALADIGEGKYQDALELTEQVASVQSYLIALFLTIELTELGRRDEAMVQLGKLLEQRPDYGRYFRMDAASRGLAPELTEGMAASLKKAGLQVD